MRGRCRHPRWVAHWKRTHRALVSSCSSSQLKVLYGIFSFVCEFYLFKAFYCRFVKYLFVTVSCICVLCMPCSTVSRNCVGRIFQRNFIGFVFCEHVLFIICVDCWCSNNIVEGFLSCIFSTLVGCFVTSHTSQTPQALSLNVY